jgi:hypothetical protein
MTVMAIINFKAPMQIITVGLEVATTQTMQVQVQVQVQIGSMLDFINQLTWINFTKRMVMTRFMMVLVLNS